MVHSHNEMSNDQLRIALVGPKGVDTSSIANEFSKRVALLDERTSFYWVDTSSEVTLVESFTRLSREFTILPKLPINPRNENQHLVHHLTWSYNGRWMMVLDGLTSASALVLRLENLLPQGLQGTLLFTSSEPNALSLLGPVKTIHVPYSRGWGIISARLKTLLAISHFISRYKHLSMASLFSYPSRPGRPSLWTQSTQRKLVRLFLYTRLPVTQILEVIHFQYLG